MSWKDKLRPASFRGVPFQVSAHTANEAGRRVQVHEFPGRDEAFAEDLGLKSTEFSLEAYVLGADYMAARDALIAACAEAGSGSLVHPYRGTHLVLCTGCALSERSDEGRVARLQLTFVKAGENKFPVASADTGLAVDRASTGALGSVKNRFASKFNVARKPAFLADSAASTVRQAAAQLLSVGGSRPSTLFTRAANDLSGGSLDLVQSASGLGDSILTLIGFAGREAGGGHGAIQALQPVTTFGSTLPPVPQTTATRRQQATNQAELTALVRRGAIIESARAAPSASYATSQEAFRVRDELGDKLDSEMTLASEAGDDEVFISLRSLRAVLVRDLNVRGPKLARLVVIRPHDTEPSLVTAHRLYGDAGRADEIVARNRVRHPGFVPGGSRLEVLGNV